MKKFKLFISGMAVCLMLASCEDPNLPFQQFPELAYGAVARLLSPATFAAAGTFTKANAAGSKLTFTVDFYDEDKGKNVESFYLLCQIHRPQKCWCKQQSRKKPGRIQCNSIQNPPYLRHPNLGREHYLRSGTHYPWFNC